jgi:uncharacterized membrane protein YqjE
MKSFEPTASVSRDVHAPGAEGLSTPELLGEIGSKAMELVAKEIDLAKAELREDYRAEWSAMKAVAAAAIAAIATLNLLLVAGVLALMAYTTPVRAALYVAGPFFIISLAAAAFAWRQRVTKPLDLTRKSIEEDVHWAKEQLA